MSDTERGQQRRVGVMVMLVSLLSVGVLTPTALAEGDEPATPPTTSEVIVAVGQPPVPPTTSEVIVAVGQPPVPPTTTPAASATPAVVPRVAVPPAAIANRPAVTVAPPEMRVSDAAQAIAARLEQLLTLLP